ncbi:MAG: hypothetical protein J4O03_13745, partial [Chloroflexi bacterium]|nr:hypothetical protein [Chloroflexota bacterium]MCI0825733.1 hypothetical protein [Chloroflexota bacterium]
MAEEQDKNDEEKFEFTAEGEALGYISLDQARVLALQHARDNAGFYGPGYANRELVWDELSAEEGEDYYRIRLSYRPVRGFRGKPGVELLAIDKSGPIALRQILSEPRPSRRLFYGLAGAGVLLAVAVTTAGLFAAGVFSSSETTTTISLSPRAPSRLVSPGGGVTVDLPADSVAAPAQLTYRPLTLTDIPVLPARYTATGAIFDLTTDSTLLKPITVSIRISAADAVAAGSDEENLLIQQHHDGAWIPLPTTVDFTASTASARVDRLSFFALTVRKALP